MLYLSSGSVVPFSCAYQAIHWICNPPDSTSLSVLNDLLQSFNKRETVWNQTATAVLCEAGVLK